MNENWLTINKNLNRFQGQNSYLKIPSHRSVAVLNLDTILHVCCLTWQSYRLLDQLSHITQIPSYSIAVTICTFCEVGYKIFVQIKFCPKTWRAGQYLNPKPKGRIIIIFVLDVRYICSNHILQINKSCTAVAVSLSPSISIICKLYLSN